MVNILNRLTLKEEASQNISAEQVCLSDVSMCVLVPRAKISNYNHGIYEVTFCGYIFVEFLKFSLYFCWNFWLFLYSVLLISDYKRIGCMTFTSNCSTKFSFLRRFR